MPSPGTARFTKGKKPLVKMALRWHEPKYLKLLQNKLGLPKKTAQELELAVKQFLIVVALHPDVEVFAPPKIDQAWHWLVLYEEARESFFCSLKSRVVHDPTKGGFVQPFLLQWAHEIFPKQVREKYWTD